MTCAEQEAPAAEAETARILSDSLTPKGIGQWLNSPNRPLGGRAPRWVLATGAVDSVLQAARSFVDGAYV